MSKILNYTQTEAVLNALVEKIKSIKVVSRSYVKPFSECSWQDVFDICQAYYDGIFTIDDIKSSWQEGDEKTVDVEAMSAPRDYTTSVATTYTYRIVGLGHDTLATAIGNHTKALLTMGIKGVTLNAGFMENNSSDSKNYYQGPCRDWVINYFTPALPSDIKSNLKTVTKVMASTTFNDPVFIPSRTEYSGEGSEGTQYKLYETIDNRKFSAATWTRSQVSGSIFYELLTTGAIQQSSLAQLNMNPHFCL